MRAKGPGRRSAPVVSIAGWSAVAAAVVLCWVALRDPDRRSGEGGADDKRVTRLSCPVARPTGRAGEVPHVASHVQGQGAMWLLQASKWGCVGRI